MTTAIDLKNLKKHKYFLKPAVGENNWRNNLITTYRVAEDLVTIGQLATSTEGNFLFLK
jgi:hypothetical protein